MFHPEYNGSQELQLSRPEILKNLFVNNRVLTEDNLSQYISLQKGIRFSFTDTRSYEEKAELNVKFKDLYEQYKNGDKQAYEEALKLVIEEAERKGYAVKVYHGTGADGFNIADAWQYLVNESQFVSILEKIYEYIEKHYKSSSIRTNQSNEISVITKGLRDSNFISKRQSDRVQGIVKRLQRRVSEGERPQLESNGLLRLGLNEDNESSNLKALQRQERSENPVYWASIVLAKEILR